MRKLAIRFLQTPVDEQRTAKFHRLASKVGDDQTVQTKVGYSDEASDSPYPGMWLALVGGVVRGWLACQPPGAGSSRACSAQVWSLLLPFKPDCDHLSCGKDVTFLAKTSLLRGPSPGVHSWIPPTLSRNWADACVKYLAIRTFRPSDSARPWGRFSAPEVATCTISCKKKVFEKQQNCACTLTATTWLGYGRDPPANFVAQMFRMKSAHALLPQERRYPEASRQVGIEGSGTSTAPQDPAPGRQQYGRSRRCP